MKNQANVVIKKGRHSRKPLSGIYNARCCQIKGNALLNRCVEDPQVLRTAKSGMTTNWMSGSHLTYKDALNKVYRLGVSPTGAASGPEDIRCKAGKLSGLATIYKGNGGFTLIELLVVVLIIGILAAVALPQYQKAVEKSRLTELMQNIRTLKQIVSMYVLENGVPTSTIGLNDIPASMELTGGEWVDIGGGNVDMYVTDYFKYICTITGSKTSAFEGGKLYCEIYRTNDKSHNLGDDCLYAIAIMQDESSECFTYYSSLGNYICQTLKQWDNNMAITEAEL